MVEFLQNYGQLLNLLSVSIIPLAIWFLGIKFQDRKSKRDVRMNLFLTLMANRNSIPLSKEWVDSLNQIDIVFQSNEKVIRAWKDYYNSLQHSDINFNLANSYKLDMLSEMANDLGYKNLKQTDIDKFYSPRLFSNIANTEDQIREEWLRILLNSKSLSKSYTDDELNNRTKEY